MLHLGDNPTKRVVWSACSNAIPTLRHSMGRLWIKGKGRWILQKELFRAMGWKIKVTRLVWRVVVFSSIDVLAQICPQAPADWNLSPLLGNSMHLACITAVAAVALASIGKVSNLQQQVIVRSPTKKEKMLNAFLNHVKNKRC